jgi:hypothetical protein
MRSLLEEMGNTIVPASDSMNQGVHSWMKAVGIAIDWEHYPQVANAEDIQDLRTKIVC